MRLHPTVFDGMLRRFEWAAWSILVLSLGAGLGQEIGSAPAGKGVGAGFRAGDITMTSIVVVAAFMQLWTLFRYKRPTHILERVAQWLLACVSTVFAFRFIWMLSTLGDIYAPPITIAAFVAYAVAQILHCLVVAGVAHEIGA